MPDNNITENDDTADVEDETVRSVPIGVSVTPEDYTRIEQHAKALGPVLGRRRVSISRAAYDLLQAGMRAVA